MFDGRKEVQQSHQTENISETRRLLAIELAKFDRLASTAIGTNRHLILGQ